MTYQEQLRDPRWQKKRLEVMERDNWTCQYCKDKNSTLSVHHKSYRKDENGFADVWDYPDNDLITLCDACHKKEESKLKRLRDDAYIALRHSADDAEAIISTIQVINTIARDKRARATTQDILLMFSVYDVYLQGLNDNDVQCFSIFVNKVNKRYKRAIKNKDSGGVENG